MDVDEEIARSRWRVLVKDTLADHPDWAADTIQAVQNGVLTANNRLRDRIADVSMGLWQALNTTRKAKRRNRAMIVRAIEASTLARTPWAEEAITKEQDD